MTNRSEQPREACNIGQSHRKIRRSRRWIWMIVGMAVLGSGGVDVNCHMTDRRASEGIHEFNDPQKYPPPRKWNGKWKESTPPEADESDDSPPPPPTKDDAEPFYPQEGEDVRLA